MSNSAITGIAIYLNLLEQYSENAAIIVLRTISALVGSNAVTSIKTFFVSRVIFEWSPLIIGGSGNHHALAVIDKRVLRFVLYEIQVLPQAEVMLREMVSKQLNAGDTHTESSSMSSGPFMALGRLSGAKTISSGLRAVYVNGGERLSRSWVPTDTKVRFLLYRTVRRKTKERKSNRYLQMFWCNFSCNSMKLA